MKAAEIRRSFLRFFEERGHRVVPSSPVVPHGDPTLLFTNAGMNQFKDVFLGLDRRDYVRATSAQKCIRAGGKHNDLENVGHTARHLTLFEMLGNFSFGDYFKREAIGFAWELVTRVLELDKARLWVTVFRDDDEAFRLWQEVAGVAPERIVRLGEKDNFWAMGDTGPCGPCSEIHFDRGAERACGPDCGIGRCDCDRVIEIWNLVFMQWNRNEKGVMTPLPKPSVDTGAGLERLAMVIQGVESNYETDLFTPLIRRIAEISGRPYEVGPAGVAHRVIADHVRSLSFAFADGAAPSNEGRGYVLRRILRRAARFGRNLGMERAFIYELVPALGEVMGEAYPEVVKHRDRIERLLKGEEESFNQTLGRGIEVFEKVVASLGHDAARTIPGEDAFRLYDTFGFPLDLTQLMAAERGLQVDLGGFEERLRTQRERSRAASTFKTAGAAASEYAALPPTIFLGYETTEAEGAVLVLNERGGDGGGGADAWELVLDRTPFYAESGGQVGDTGTIEGLGFRFDVRDTRKQGNAIVHTGRLEGERPEPGTPVRARVDASRRTLTLKNHTATHLLHWALHQVLGGHATQQGSLVHPDYLRFDFQSGGATPEESLRKIEAMVNEKVYENHEVKTYERSRKEALDSGVVALFGEKYGERVRVVDTGGFSRELCGGTHVRRTGDIGYMKIVQETGIAAGVRRIVALTGPLSVARSIEERAHLRELARTLSVPEDRVVERVRQVLEQVKELKQQQKAAAKAAGTGSGSGAKAGGAAAAGAGPGAGEAWEEGGVQGRWSHLAAATAQDLLPLADKVKAEVEPVLAVLSCGPIAAGGEAGIVVVLSAAARKLGLDAGTILKAATAVTGGGGGGRPDLAQGRGKDGSKLPEAIAAVRAKQRELLAAKKA